MSASGKKSENNALHHAMMTFAAIHPISATISAYYSNDANVANTLALTCLTSIMIIWVANPKNEKH